MSEGFFRYHEWRSQTAVKSALDTKREMTEAFGSASCEDDGYVLDRKRALIEGLGSDMIDGYERGVNDMSTRDEIDRKYYAKGSMGPMTKIVNSPGHQGRTTTETVHHTVPVGRTTACGLGCSPLPGNQAASAMPSGIIRERNVSGRQIDYSYDFSAVTCDECRRILTTPVTDAETQQAIEDAGWLKSQGENFASLRLLVEAVNGPEKLLIAEAAPFKRYDLVRQIALNLHNLRSEGDADETEPCDVCGEEEFNARLICTACEQGRQPSAPVGGLSHDHTNWLVRKVRGAIQELRAGQAWPDDARRVAAELEDRLDKILGTSDEPKPISCESKRT